MRTLLLMGRPAATPSLDLSTGGTFARALAAFHYTQAPTDGSSSFLTSVSSGIRRSADTRGDGIGASLLMEKSATNYLVRSRAIDHAAWTAGAGTVTADQQAGPDGSGLADRSQLASGQFGPYQSTPGPSGRVTLSSWVRAVSGTSQHQHVLLENGATSRLKASQVATSTTWQRHETSETASVNSGAIIADGRDLAGLGTPGGSAAHAEDDYIDLSQLEAGYYPTSPIDTTTVAVARPADTLSYATGAYPVGFLTNGVVIVFAPDASSAEIVSANELWTLVQNGPTGIGTDHVRIRNDSGACKVELLCGNTIKGTLTVTFSRGQALTITAKPSAGTITVAGATTGDGTNGGSGAAWASTQTLYVGGNSAGANNVTGRYVGAVITEAV